jgi:hypothetical protein
MEVTSEEVYLIIECCPNIRRLIIVLESTDAATPDPVIDVVHSSLYSPKVVISLSMLEIIYLKSYHFFHHSLFSLFHVNYCYSFVFPHS